jgi:tRNA(Ile2) C34 agmatinyltransferase TiaS
MKREGSGGEKDGGRGHWICRRCNLPLEVVKVRITYMGSVFSLDLPKCPQCGTVMVDEAMATGRMAEAEKVLEDK